MSRWKSVVLLVVIVGAAVLVRLNVHPLAGAILGPEATASPSTTASPARVAIDQSTEQAARVRDAAARFTAVYQAGKVDGGPHWVLRLSGVATSSLTQALALEDPDTISGAPVAGIDVLGPATALVTLTDGTAWRLTFDATGTGLVAAVEDGNR